MWLKLFNQEAQMQFKQFESVSAAGMGQPGTRYFASTNPGPFELLSINLHMKKPRDVVLRGF
jgi:hypothetical protein